jgi:hypothetical protein
MWRHWVVPLARPVIVRLLNDASPVIPVLPIETEADAREVKLKTATEANEAMTDSLLRRERERGFLTRMG